MIDTQELLNNSVRACIKKSLNIEINKNNLIIIKRNLIDQYQKEVTFNINEYADNILFERWGVGICTIALDVYLGNIRENRKECLEFYSKLDKYAIPQKYLRNLMISLMLSGTIWTTHSDFPKIKEQMLKVLNNQFNWIEVDEFLQKNPEYI